jgi:aryl-alcohol dehydrogenase-like predicted oxidoreductase
LPFRLLGNSGVKVSSLCLGTMTFGSEADETISRQIIDRYLDAGGNFIDTADVYSRGLSEEIVGRALGSRRDRVILATKGRAPMSDEPNDQGASRRYLIRAVDASLRRLGTGWIDLYQIHWPDPAVAPEETFSALDALVRAGKIRMIGVSNYLGSHLATALALCDRYGWARPVSLQPQYSLVSREIELEILPVCRRSQLAVIPYSPLGGGVLTGKYRPGSAPGPDTRYGASGPQARAQLTERNLTIAEAVSKVADATGHTPAQVALNWVLHRPGVTAPIIGARTVEQLEANLGAEGWQLDDADLETLDRASRLRLPYPQSLYRFLGIEV